MIVELASPSVCVIDDEPDDFNSIRYALNDLFISAVWIAGTSLDQLPPQPFKRLQLVFLDLHLTNSLGKDAASHTANVFRHVVSTDTAPIVVVIWSKYADDLVAEAGVPQEDQETESELFKRTLFEAEPKFESRLLFPRALLLFKKEELTGSHWLGRPAKEASGFNTWQSTCYWIALDVGRPCWRCKSPALAASLNPDLAEESAGDADPELTDADMKEVLQRLTNARQSEGDLLAENAPGYLVAILSQLLADQIEHGTAERALAGNGAWLAQAPGSRTKASVVAKMNGFLLTADPPGGSPPYMPGIDACPADNIWQRVLSFCLASLSKFPKSCSVQ